VAAPAGAGALLAWQAGDAGPRYLQPPIAGSDGVSRLSRTVTIPADMPAPTLSLMLDLDKPWADPRGTFEARVRDASGKATALLTTSEPTTGWQHRWFDLTPWQGQTVTVELESAWQRGGPLMHAYADEFTLGSGAHADTWAAASVGGILPGQTGRATLAHGNRGDVDAADVALRVTLPAGVTLVAANPPAAAEGGEWVWRLAGLPAGATGRVEVDLRNDTAGGDPGRLSATITPGPGEIQTGNNATAAMVWGRARGWLPRVGR
jgi:hypothetical protein